MKSLKRTLYGWIDRRFLCGCSNFNSLATRRRCRSKRLARAMFAEHNIPHARGQVFYGFLAPFRFARKFGFPLVIKPNVGGFSRGSHFPLTSYGQLLKATLLVKLWWPSSVVEEYLEGRNYRVLVSRDRIVSIIRRYPPQVVGDGLATIEELIDRENEARSHLRLYPTMHPIAKDGMTLRYLARSGRTLQSVPAPGEEIRLHHRIALATGGVVETIDRKTIPRDTIELFLKIPDLLQANLLGIDAIFAEGIETPWRQQRVILLEVNSRPYLKMHEYPRYGEKDDLRPCLQHLATLAIDDRDVF